MPRQNANWIFSHDRWNGWLIPPWITDDGGTEAAPWNPGGRPPQIPHSLHFDTVLGVRGNWVITFRDIHPIGDDKRDGKARNVRRHMRSPANTTAKEE